MIFLLNSYVHFYNCHFRSQLLLPYNPFTVYQFILAFTTLHSFVSMDFLPALLLPFSRTALHTLSMRCSTGIITPYENWPSLFFFTVLCIQSLIRAKISPLFSLAQFAFQAFKGLCQKLFVNPHCEKVMVKAQHNILFTIRLHPLPLYIQNQFRVCVCMCAKIKLPSPQTCGTFSATDEITCPSRTIECQLCKQATNIYKTHFI